MNRVWLNFIVDLVTALVGLAVVLTGLLIAYILPAGSRGAEVWQWTRHDWGDLHFYLAMSMLGLILVHLFLHWSWVCTMICRCTIRRSGQPPRWLQHVSAIVVLVLLVSLVGGFLWFAASVKTENVPAGRAERSLDSSATTMTHPTDEPGPRQRRLRLGRTAE